MGDVFWWGLICGICIGSLIGVFMMAICVAGGKKYDPRDIRDIRETDQ
jgi:hypothetical protein